MLLKPTCDADGAYGFRFHEKSQNDIATLYVIGWENWTSTDYDWDGNIRKDVGTFIFQYTLSGNGRIEIDNHSFPLTAGYAFMVEVPSNHRYFVPENSEGWEFIYITLQGREAAKCWNYIKQSLGSVLKISPDSPLIQLLFNIYKDTTARKINDPFIASLKAYEFIMECYRFFKNIKNEEHETPDTITKAILFIQSQYHQPISLDDMANEAQLSKYYFIKKFTKHMNISPLQFLTKVRIERAFILLRDTNMTINEIAEQVGYDNANYFNKVFRKIVGISPGQLRKDRNSAPFNHLIID